MTLGQKLKEMRRKMGLSQEALGEIICVSRQAITKWENDTGIPDISNLQELSKIFGTTIDYLLNENNTLPLLQMKVDVSNEKNNKESNDEIIKHYYSDEWKVRNLKNYGGYPKNKFLLYLYACLLSSELPYFLNLFSFFHRNSDDNNKYYLLTKDDINLLAHIENNQLEVNELGNIPTENKHFIFNDTIYIDIKKFKDETKEYYIDYYVKLPLFVLFMVLIAFAIIAFFVLLVQ